MSSLGISTERRNINSSVTLMCMSMSRIPLKGGYSLVTAYVINRRKNPENSAEAIMFQVEIKAYSEDGSAVFCRTYL